MSTIDDHDPHAAWLEDPSTYEPIGEERRHLEELWAQEEDAADVYLDGGDKPQPSTLTDQEPSFASRQPVPAEALAAMAPDGQLLAELEDIDPREVDEYFLVEMAAGYQRMAAWATAKLTRVAGELSRRPLMNGSGALPSHVMGGNMAADELAPRLGLTRFAAQRIVSNARAFESVFSLTGQALAIGHIDARKATTIVSMLEDYPVEIAVLVQDAVIDDAGTQTHNQLVEAIKQAVIAVGHDDADLFHARARARRRVEHPRQLPDGMASIRAVVPATDAAAIDLALEAAARSAQAGGDDRTLDQLRADIFALMGHTALELGYVGLPPGTVVGADQPAGPADDEPADGAARGADEEPDGPAPQEPEAVDEPEPPGPDEPGSPAAPPADPDPPDRRSEGAAPPTAGPAAPPPPDPPPPGPGTVPRRWHMPVGHIGGHRAQIRVTVPLSVLLPPDIARQLGLPASKPADGSGAELAPLPDEDAVLALLDREPAEVATLEGYGPISPAVARAMALGGTWRRIVTDPLSGTVLDHGRTRYRPPADLAELVRLRDGTCVRAGCTHPARGCQLDHVVPWSAGGTTSMLGLEDLCSHDHNLKTSGEFRLRRLGGGAYEGDPERPRLPPSPRRPGDSRPPPSAGALGGPGLLRPP
ncbi:HNH endonuclease [Georgenia satyanarayanai]|uniref:HNH endonuclease n=1 Tax=Georgenia satyanarayanai TaxID=860221 RepID=UPI001264C0F6|nr:HNH endonuclease signature motif containing protein [Georgenia satyanarayanai]